MILRHKNYYNTSEQDFSRNKYAERFLAENKLVFTGENSQCSYVSHERMDIKIIHLYKANVLLAPHPCGENCFCVIRDFSDCIDFS